MKLRKLFLLLAVAGISALAQSKELEDDCNCPDQRKEKEFAKIMKEIQDDDELNLKPDTAARFRGGDSLLHVYMQSRIINPAKNLQDSVKYSAPINTMNENMNHFQFRINIAMRFLTLIMLSSSIGSAAMLFCTSCSFKTSI